VALAIEERSVFGKRGPCAHGSTSVTADGGGGPTLHLPGPRSKFRAVVGRHR